MSKRYTYFVSDVHLGLQVADPAGREARFVSFLKGLPQETDALYLLGGQYAVVHEILKVFEGLQGCTNIHINAL